MKRLSSLTLLLASTLLTLTSQAQPSLNQIIVGDHRSTTSIQRNIYRHPIETLQFFALEPQHHVLEVWPGSGWYTEVLAPYLRESGEYVVAHFSQQQDIPFMQQMRSDFVQKMQQDPTRYDRVKITSLYPPGGKIHPAAPASIDRILTFRNVHNWAKAGFDQAMFDAFFQMLKPGGILGVVEHRAKPGTTLENMIKSGYMTTEHVIQLAKKSGFALQASSEINANPKDNANHPSGVWSLPPSLRGGPDTQAQFLAIGESDRMTLKFIKPEK